MSRGPKGINEDKKAEESGKMKEDKKVRGVQGDK
jgi:hypothetical protein